MRTSIAAALAGLCAMAVLLAGTRRSARIRRLLGRNVVASIGGAVAASGVALLAAIPITRDFSDAGRLWCGTYVIRSENWPAACDAWGVYSQRFELARWPLLCGLVLLVGANLWPNLDHARRPARR